MNVSEKSIRQLTITGIKRMDPIRVMIEDFILGKGQITITCWDRAWVNYWGAMGNNTLSQFFQSCGTDYLANKLQSGIECTVCDEEAQAAGCRAEVIRQRRDGDIEKDEARTLWNEIDSAYFDAQISENADLFYDIFGDEWRLQLPQRPNPEYVYLCAIIDAVKSAMSISNKGESK